MTIQIINEIEHALLADPNNSVAYVAELVRRLQREMDNQYHDGYQQAQYDVGVIIVRN